MEFDKWFYKQSTVIQAVLLLVPFVNWVVEILIRLSIMLRTKSPLDIVIFVVLILLGAFWIIGVIDFIVFLVTGKLLFDK